MSRYMYVCHLNYPAVQVSTYVPRELGKVPEA